MDRLLPEALALHRQGRLEEAAKRFDTIVAADPRNYEARFHLGDIRRKQGDFAQAAEHFAAAAQTDPRSYPARLNAGLAFRECGRGEEAAGWLMQAVALEPDAAQVHQILGITLHEIDKADAALIHLKSAVRLSPDNATSWFHLGNLLRDLDRSGEAASCFGRALAIHPEYVEAAANLGELHQATGRLTDAMNVYRSILTEKPECDLVASNLLMAMNYDDSPTADETFTAHCAWGEHRERVVAPLPVVARDLRVRPLRIGYVSPDFRNHAVAWFIEPLLAGHDRTAFQVYCYSAVRRPDAVTARLAAQADQWRDIAAVDDDAAARLIRSDQIDILIDLAGHTGGNRLGIFTRKPAPVQATYLGYPNTTGLSRIDYRITDSMSDPAGQDRFYSEKLCRIEGCFLCYQPPAISVPQRPPMRDMPRPIVFGSFNNSAKISDSTVALWSGILKQVKDAVLVLKSQFLDNQEVAVRIRQRFEGHGIDSKRLVVMGRTASLTEHLARYTTIDICLDTAPYNGTTTTCEALWMGVPVIALSGDRHSARVGVSLLHAVGVPELVAALPEEYVAVAAQLARDPGRRATYHSFLRERMVASPLCDRMRFVRKIEAALAEMWRGY
jgi:protein O-GlcNAc transferase